MPSKQSELDAAARIAWWTERLASPSFVYVIGTHPGDPIKIGVAKNVKARLAGLQTGNPYKLNVLLALPGEYELEWQLHQKLGTCRLEGEWFDGAQAQRLLPDLQRLSDAMAEAYDGSGAIPTYRVPGFVWKRVKHRAAGVKIIQIDPAPVDPELAEERLRAAWMRPRRRGDFWSGGGSHTSGSIS